MLVCNPLPSLSGVGCADGGKRGAGFRCMEERRALPVAYQEHIKSLFCVVAVQAERGSLYEIWKKYFFGIFMLELLFWTDNPKIVTAGFMK